MAGTREGGLKARDKNLAVDPSFYKKIGHAGGLAQVPKGFATMRRSKHIKVSSLGGKRSRK